MDLTLYAMNGENPATGYGKMEIGLRRGLESAGVNVLSRARADNVAIVTGNPLHKEGYRGKARLWSYTMSESDRLSDEWVACLNADYERVLVPCPGLVNIYRDSGVSVPVHCVPLGVDFSPIQHVQREVRPKVFNFLTYSIGDVRKSAELAMFAFNRLFKGNPRVRLIVKCRDELNWLAGLEDEQIEIVHGESSEADWHALMARSHAFIFASKGEGFGLPPREAVLSGLPVIATKWLGMWDVDYWGYPVTVDFMIPAYFDVVGANAKDCRYAMPRIADIDRHMLRIYHQYKRALNRAQRGRAYLLSRFTWDRTGRMIVDLVEQTSSAETGSQRTVTHDARVLAH